MKIVEPVDPIDPVDHVYVPRDIVVGLNSPSWYRKTLHEEEEHATPHGTFRESKRPQIFSNYVVVVSHIIDYEPSYYEEASSQ
jgi:hypothetical protein